MFQSHDILLFVSVFLASTVEAVEALTIVLSVGTTRSWRSTWIGVAGAIISLALITVIFGTGLRHLPINGLRIFVGSLLLIFGLGWLKKAILRSSGRIPLHDEDKIFKAESKHAKAAAEERHGRIDDWYSFIIAFKGVLLEGLEIVFIVITFGLTQGKFAPSIAGAIVAVVIVSCAGFLIRKPLTKVPENQLKFIVGVMLTSFGIFWVSEGVGISWPGSDLALLWIILLMACVSLFLSRLLVLSPNNAKEL